VVINPGIKAVDGVKYLDFLTEEEYLEILNPVPKENQYLDDVIPDKFIADMGAEALYKLAQRYLTLTNCPIPSSQGKY
jgi:DNA-directed RNA polymerase subunit beta'